jgi:hypothetical protein
MSGVLTEQQLESAAEKPAKSKKKVIPWNLGDAKFIIAMSRTKRRKNNGGRHTNF